MDPVWVRYISMTELELLFHLDLAENLIARVKVCLVILLIFTYNILAGDRRTLLACNIFIY
jgi:hypothetical protein